MQLDRTHVVIRLRSLSEIGDLALVMIRRYPATGVAFAGGAMVWILADLLLLGWIPLYEHRFGLSDPEAVPQVMRYALWMLTLVCLQAPAAGAFMTCYIGQAVFEERPGRREVVDAARRHWRRWIWALGFQRLAIPAMLVAALRWGQPGSLLWDLLVPGLLLTAAGWMRAVRPFLPEILLLERCPFRRESPQVITASRRSQSLHNPLAGDNVGRFLAVSVVLGGLFVSLFYTLIFVRGVLTGLWNYLDLVVLLLLYPLSLWAIAYVSVLIRFLLYLDARIRLEGWEVELAIQAEAQRQFGSEREWLSPRGVPRHSSPPPMPKQHEAPG